MRLVFMGSPSEVIAPLEALIRHCHQSDDQILAVVSQPAKPAGRKQTLADPPLAAFAKEHNLLCLQPIKASDPLFLAELSKLEVDVIITAAYGQILSTAFLAIPKRATINIHPSLLPAYRGAIPVPAALLDGHMTTGVTVLFTVKALDAGSIIVQESFAIDAFETAADLTARLFQASGPMLLQALDRLRDPSFIGIAQDESQVTICKKIAKADGAIAWHKNAQTLMNEFRAYQPWPGSYTERDKVRIVIEAMSSAPPMGEPLAPGEFLFDRNEKTIRVGTGTEALAIRRLKSSGSKSVDAIGFWNGLRLTGKGQFEVACQV